MYDRARVNLISEIQPALRVTTEEAELYLDRALEKGVLKPAKPVTKPAAKSAAKKVAKPAVDAKPKAAAKPATKSPAVKAAKVAKAVAKKI